MSAVVVAGVICAIGLLHVYWGFGGRWPGRDDQNAGLGERSGSDDTVVMLGDSGAEFPPFTSLIRVYVDDVDRVYQRALEAGATPVEAPKTREGDPDKRGRRTLAEIPGRSRGSSRHRRSDAR